MKPDKNIVIVEAKLADVEEILRIKDEVWLTTYPNEAYGITREDIMSRKGKNPERAALLRGNLSNRRDFSHIWIAKEGKSIVGMCSAEKEVDECKIGALYVLPDYQRAGLGRRFLSEAMGWLGDEKDISLGVAEYNTGAIRFYEKNGFEISGPMEGFELACGKKIPLLGMVKKTGKL